MKNIDIMHDYIENNLSRSNLMKKHKLSTSAVNSLTNRFHPTVTFDSKKLFDTIKDDLTNLTTTVFLKKYVINFEKTLQLKNGGTRITYKKLITWLKELNIPYTLTFKEKSQTSSKLTLRIGIHGYVEPEKEIQIEKRGQVYMMTQEEKKDYLEKISIVQGQQKALIERLYDKQIHPSVIGTIVDSMNVITREALRVGIIAEKNGYGNKVEYALARKVEER